MEGGTERKKEAVKGKDRRLFYISVSFSFSFSVSVSVSFSFSVSVSVSVSFSFSVSVSVSFSFSFSFSVSFSVSFSFSFSFSFSVCQRTSKQARKWMVYSLLSQMKSVPFKTPSPNIPWYVDKDG